MRRALMALTVSTLVLACPDPGANAQPYPGGSSIQPDQMQQRIERGPSGRYDRDDEYEDRDDWRRPGYFERGARMGERGGRGMMEGRRPEMGDDRERRPQHPYHRGPAFGTMGMMGPPMGAGMTAMMMILMDSDGDGAVSLQEFLGGQERIFKAMDADKDGRLTLEELRNFRPGSRVTTRQ
jgi:hypothetical protein